MFSKTITKSLSNKLVTSLPVTPSQVYSLIGLLRKKGMNVRVIRKSVERQIYREARQYIEEHNCEISIAKACRDLNVSREQLNNMIHKFRKNGMQISINPSERTQ